MNFVRHLALAAIVLAGSAAARADEAADTFNKLFGEDLKRVEATPTPADDIALAKQLLEAAEKAANQPVFLTLLCEKAYELAVRDPAGYPTARAAIVLLAAFVPEKTLEAFQKIAALDQRSYATAHAEGKAKAGEAAIESLKALADAQLATEDSNGAIATLKQALAVATQIRAESWAALQAQLSELTARQQLEKQSAALKAKLDADPKDAASRKELVRLYLVEMDNPAEAAKLVDETLDEATRKCLPAAAKPLEEMPEATCTELGDWYRTLADQAASPANKGAMLRRAQGYCQRFLVLHTADDLSRTAATLTLKKIEDSLAKLEPATPPAAATWIDCLKLVDVTKHVVSGTWEKKGDRLYSTGAGRVMLPVAPPGSYELRVTFVRIAGTATVAIALPVGPTSCALVFSAAKASVSGLESMNGINVGKSSIAVRPGTLENGREYAVDIKVTLRGEEAEIVATVDNKPFQQWKGPVSALSNDSWSMPNPKYPGVGAWQGCNTIFRSAKILMHPAEGKSPKPLPAAAKGD